MSKIVYVHTTSTDQFEFGSVGDALNYIEEHIESACSESITIYVKDSEVDDETE